MYIRVKRQKTTVFLQVEPTDTVLEIKQKLQGLIEQPPDKVQLHKQLANGSYEQLEDSKKLADLKVENDDVVAMCYMQEDGSGFEAIKISTPGEDAAGNGEQGVKQEA
eukprot:GHUV01029316.1.p3 GENE.GHUV01029316.1~~GHUV01029316.1.p3  ORF type:complete len:108 (+),score=44.26 GHUV01029316.1:368-691(+)